MSPARSGTAIGPGSSSARKVVFALSTLGVCAIVLLVHMRDLAAGAVFLDDRYYVTGNEHVLRPSLGAVGRFFGEVSKPSTVPGYYQPLTMVSLMLDVAIRGPSKDLTCFHGTSLLLHAANSMLMGLFLYLLFGDIWASIAASLLFGLHPITVESICWLSERKTVLASCFALLSLVLYVRFTAGRRRINYVGSLASYALALLAKPTALPLPAVMVLIDYWPLGRLCRRTLLEKLPVILIGVVSAVVTYISQSHAASVKLPGQYDTGQFLLGLCHNILFYMGKIVWPGNLSPHYDLAHRLTLSNPAMWGVISGVCLLIAFLVLALRWTRAPLAGCLIFFVMLFPTMSPVRVTQAIAANRYVYLPSVGLLILVASLVHAYLAPRGRPSRLRRHLTVLAILLALCAIDAVLVRGYARRWQDTRGLYAYALSRSPGSAVLHHGLACELEARGAIGDAVRHYIQALENDSTFLPAHQNLALLLQRSPTSIGEAEAHFREAIELNPRFARAHACLGMLLCRRGQFEDGLHHLYLATEADADFSTDYCHYCRTRILSGQVKEGVKNLREILRVYPCFPMAADQLAWILATHPDRAVRDPNEAVQIADQARECGRENDPVVLDTLAASYAAMGLFEKAVLTAEKSLHVASENSTAGLPEQIARRLALYRDHRAYFEDPTKPNGWLDGPHSP